jgi:hypothetical protein
LPAREIMDPPRQLSMIAFGDTIQALRKQRTMEHPPPKQPNFAGGLLGACPSNAKTGLSRTKNQ